MVHIGYIILACVKTLRSARSHLFVQFEVIRSCGDGHEAEESAELLSAPGVLKLQTELQGLQSRLQLPINLKTHNHMRRKSHTVARLFITQTDWSNGSYKSLRPLNNLTYTSISANKHKRIQKNLAIL